MAKEYSIGELARRTGVKVPTIRYYEEIGILAQPSRTQSGQRRYGDAARDQLNFIAHGREMGFSLEAIRSLLGLAAHPEKSCENADVIATERLADVERRIARLERLRGELKRMLDGHCSGKSADCRIIEVLSDHGNCVAEH